MFVNEFNKSNMINMKILKIIYPLLMYEFVINIQLAVQPKITIIMMTIDTEPWESVAVILFGCSDRTVCAVRTVVASRLAHVSLFPPASRLHKREEDGLDSRADQNIVSLANSHACHCLIIRS